jgi:hypothetical protein
VIFELQGSRRALKPSPNKLLGNVQYLVFLPKKNDQYPWYRTISGFNSSDIFPSKDVLLYFRLFHKANVIPVVTLVYQIKGKFNLKKLQTNWVPFVRIPV